MSASGRRPTGSAQNLPSVPPLGTACTLSCRTAETVITNAGEVKRRIAEKGCTVRLTCARCDHRFDAENPAATWTLATDVSHSDTHQGRPRRSRHPQLSRGRGAEPR